MRDFVSLLIAYMLMAFADSVDNAFSHNISLDAVVVCGCISTIGQLTRSLAKFGTYSYRIIREHETQCLQLDLISSSIVGIVVFFSKDLLISLFQITQSQQELFRSMLIVWSFYIPFSIMGNATFEIVRLQGKIKLFNTGLFIFYVCLILSDIVAFTQFHTLESLWVATCISQIVGFIFFNYNMRWKFELLTIDFLKEALPYGISICGERLVNGICLLFYGVLASKLDNMSYAVHSICNSIMCSAEEITNSYNSALMIKAPLDKPFKETLDSIKYWFKKVVPLLIITYYIYMYTTLFIEHGKVPIEECFPWFIAYTFEFIGLCIYENFKVLCAVQKYVKALPVGAVGGFCCRFGISALGFLTPFPLIFFGISSCIDWSVRGLIYYRSVYKHSLSSSVDN